MYVFHLHLLYKCNYYLSTEKLLMASNNYNDYYNILRVYSKYIYDVLIETHTPLELNSVL